MPRSQGPTARCSAFAEPAGRLPMAEVTALAMLVSGNLRDGETTPIVIGASPPEFVPREKWERTPRRIGRLQRQVPVARLALRSKTGVLDALREKHVQVLPFQVETAHYILHGDHGGRGPVRAFNECAQAAGFDLLPDTQQPAIDGGAKALRKEMHILEVAPRFTSAKSGLTTSFRPAQSAELRLFALPAVPRSIELAKPLVSPPEEFLAWLQVPLFEQRHYSTPGVCSKLSGRTGLEEILGSPRPARPAKSDEAEPSFSGIKPLFGESRLNTIRPALLTRNDKFLNDAEEQLRNSLSSQFAKGKFPLGGVNFTRQETISQVFGRQVDIHQLIGHAHEIVGDALLHFNAGGFLNQIIEALQVLNVERADDVDARAQKFLDVLVALDVLASGGVGVGQFIDQAHHRSPRQ